MSATGESAVSQQMNKALRTTQWNCRAELSVEQVLDTELKWRRSRYSEKRSIRDRQFQNQRYCGIGNFRPNAGGQRLGRRRQRRPFGPCDHDALADARAEERLKHEPLAVIGAVACAARHKNRYAEAVGHHSEHHFQRARAVSNLR